MGARESTRIRKIEALLLHAATEVEKEGNQKLARDLRLECGRFVALRLFGRQGINIIEGLAKFRIPRSKK